MRKFLSLLCCFIMLVCSVGTFSACGGDDGSSDDYVLTIGYDNGGYGLKWLEHAVEKFCAEEGIDPNTVYIEAEKNYTSTLMEKLDNDTSIRDIVLGCGPNVREWAARGWIEPIDDVLKEYKLSNGSTIEEYLTEPKLIETGHVNNSRGDHYYVLPTGGGAWGIYYNKTLFEQKGWNVPKTYTELIALCEKIYQENVKGVKNDNDKIYPFACSSDIYNYWDFLVENWLVQLLGIDEFNEFCKLEGPEVYAANSIYGKAKKEALEAWSKIAIENGEHYVLGNASSFLATQILFAQGKVAMMPNGNWFENEVSASLPDGVEISLMPTPYLENAKKDGEGNYIQVNFASESGGWFIPSAAKHKDMAKKFIKFMMEDEQLKDVLLDSGAVFPYKVDYSSVVDKLTVCQKSVYDVINASVNFRFLSTSKLAMTNYASLWIKGLPYEQMLTGSQLSAKQIVDNEEAYANAEWQNMMELAEL